MRSTAFETRINGIACTVLVTAYTPPTPSNRQADPADDPHDCGEFGFMLFDERGDRARWLERLVTPADEDRIYREYTDG